MKKKHLLWIAPFLLIAASWFAREKILYYAGRILVTETTLQNADAIVILMGKVSDRTPLAAMLWQEKRAPVVIFAHNEDEPLTHIGFKTNDAEATKIYLQRLGVAEDAIHVLNDVNVTSTTEEAETLVAYLLKAFPPRPRVILVTSWSHTSRALFALKKESKDRIDFMVAPATTEKNRPETWWLSEEGFLEVFQEYLKWIYYLLK